MTIIEQKRPAQTAAAKAMRGRAGVGFREALVVKQVATPVACQGEMVVRIETSGLCHTDVHAFDPLEPELPAVRSLARHTTTREGAMRTCYVTW